MWWARREDAVPALLKLLDDTERQRWQAYRRDEDRERFLVGCSLAKAAVARANHTTATQVRLDRACSQCGKPHGKPHVTGSDVQLSVSHSGDRVVVAVAAATPVGVDVEHVRKASDPEALARYVLADSEREGITPGDFFTLWARKEAVTKATGDGLRVPFRDVIVSAPAAEPAVLAWPYPEPPETVTLTDLDAGPDYAAALAVLGRCGSVAENDGSALLAAALE